VKRPTPAPKRRPVSPRFSNGAALSVSVRVRRQTRRAWRSPALRVSDSEARCPVSPVRKTGRCESAIICQQAPLVRSAQIGDRRRSQPHRSTRLLQPSTVAKRGCGVAGDGGDGRCRQRRRDPGAIAPPIWTTCSSATTSSPAPCCSAGISTMSPFSLDPPHSAGGSVRH
jgi:hypothetical protein